MVEMFVGRRTKRPRCRCGLHGVGICTSVMVDVMMVCDVLDL